MSQELLDYALKQISNLEKRVERYFQLLKIENELDFILSGTYFFEDELDNILSGNY